MENASKALLMAAGILVGVLLISIGVYLFTVFGDSSAEISGQLEQSQIDQFNAQFYKYEGSKECRIHDIISVANLAKANNASYGYENGENITINKIVYKYNLGQFTDGTTPANNNYYISVSIRGSLNSGDQRIFSDNIENLTKDGINYLLKNYSTKQVEEDGKITFKPIYFSCGQVKTDGTVVNGITINDITKKVNKVVFYLLD